MAQLFHVHFTEFHATTQNLLFVHYHQWSDALEPAFRKEAGKTLTKDNFLEISLGLYKCFMTKCEPTTNPTSSGIRRQLRKNKIKEVL